jgi:hypothetical protein
LLEAPLWRGFERLGAAPWPASLYSPLDRQTRVGEQIYEADYFSHKFNRLPVLEIYFLRVTLFVENFVDNGRQP